MNTATASFSTSPFLTFEDGYFIDSSTDQTSFFVVSFGPSDGTARRCLREAGLPVPALPRTHTADVRINKTHRFNSAGQVMPIGPALDHMFYR